METQEVVKEKQFEPKSISKFRKGSYHSGSANLMGVASKGKKWHGWVNSIVAEALGGKWDNGDNTRFPNSASALHYLIRRFGLPVRYSDEYKDLCSYILSTPMNGVYLTIRPQAYDCSFGYMVNKDINKKMWEAETNSRKAWYMRCRRWTKKTYGEYLISLDPYSSWFGRKIIKRDKKKDILYFDKEENILLTKLYNNWCLYHNKKQLSQKKEGERFYGEFAEYQEHVIEYFTGLYEKIEPHKRYSPDVPIVKNVMAALSTTATDLLRIVWVRDCYFNILGQPNADEQLMIQGCFGEEGAYAKSFDINSQVKKLRA